MQNNSTIFSYHSQFRLANKIHNFFNISALTLQPRCTLHIILRLLPMIHPWTYSVSVIFLIFLPYRRPGIFQFLRSSVARFCLFFLLELDQIYRFDFMTARTAWPEPPGSLETFLRQLAPACHRSQ